MRKSYLVFLLSFALCANVLADVVSPDILAICRVKLKNGKSIEAIVKMASGGWGNYKQNGFCYIRQDGNVGQLKLFDLSFSEFRPGFHRHNPPTKLFYVINQTSGFYPESSIKVDTNKLELSINDYFVQDYKLSRKMVLYKSLPLDLYLSSTYSDTLLINVDEIMEFELSKTPDIKWLEYISLARQKLNNQIQADIKEDDSAWPDYVEPVWYHEVLNDHEKLYYILEHF